MKYSFHNGGTIYFFNPIKDAYDVREGIKQNSLTFHTKLVKEFDRLDVFICNERGQIIVKSDKPSTHVPADWRKIVKRVK